MQKVKVDFFIAPETAIPGSGGLSENGFAYSHVLNSIQDFTKQYPQSVFLTGASTYKVYSSEEKASETAYLVGNVGVWVDSYNTALQIVQDKDRNLSQRQTRTWRRKFSVYHGTKAFVG